jgi:hypothetical protein
MYSVLLVLLQQDGNLCGGLVHVAGWDTVSLLAFAMRASGVDCGIRALGTVTLVLAGDSAGWHLIYAQFQSLGCAGDARLSRVCLLVRKACHVLWLREVP